MSVHASVCGSVYCLFCLLQTHSLSLFHTHTHSYIQSLPYTTSLSHTNEHKWYHRKFISIMTNTHGVTKMSESLMFCQSRQLQPVTLCSFPKCYWHSEESDAESNNICSQKLSMIACITTWMGDRYVQALGFVSAPDFSGMKIMCRLHSNSFRWDYKPGFPVCLHMQKDHTRMWKTL